jgi:hypothetical protein
MKKTVLLLSLIVTVGVNMKANNHTNGSKPGILQIDHYGAFSGDQIVDFLNGNNAAEFEKKATIKLATYRVMVENFVKGSLGEASIASTIDNSTIKAIPAGTKVRTARNDGTWITRDAYPGEKGFNHTPTGINWISFSCMNLTDVQLGTPVKPAPPAVAPADATGVNQITNVTTGKGEMTAMEYLGAASIAEAKLLAAQQSGVAIFKDGAYFAKGLCNGCGSSGSVTTYREVVTSGVTTAGITTPSNINVTNRYKPNVLDYFNTAANVSNAINRWFPQDVNVNMRGLVNVVGTGGGVQQNNIGPYSGGVDLGSQGQLPNNVFVNQASPGLQAPATYPNGW